MQGCSPNSPLPYASYACLNQTLFCKEKETKAEMELEEAIDDLAYVDDDDKDEDFVPPEKRRTTPRRPARKSGAVAQGEHH